MDEEINPKDLPEMTTVLRPVTECLDLNFHTKRGICVRGASLIAGKRTAADSSFLCTEKRGYVE